MWLGRLIITLLLICPGVFANTITFSGTFKKGVTDRYCIKASSDTSFEADLQSNKSNCLTFLDYTGEIGRDCGTESYLYADNVPGGMTYFIVTARLKNANLNNVDYTLWLNSSQDMEAGVCPGDALASAAGMSGEQLNFMLSLSGLVIAIMFFGSITHIILTIKEW